MVLKLKIMYNKENFLIIANLIHKRIIMFVTLLRIKEKTLYLI